MVEVGEARSRTAAVRSRTPKSARAVLQLLALLARSDGPVRADAAASSLGKGLSSTYDLLDVLCREGFALHVDGGYVLADPGRAAAVAVAGAGLPAGPSTSCSSAPASAPTSPPRAPAAS